MVVDGEVFGVEHERRRVEIDANAGFEEGPVVGALSVVDHELVAFCADEQFHGDAALGGGGDGVEQ